MALTVSDSGTKTATGSGTEDDLSTKTAAGVYVLGIDTATLINDVSLTLRIYTKVLSGGTERLVYEAVYKHAQGEPTKYSPPVPVAFSIRCTIAQSNTGTAFPWSLMTL